MIIVFLSTTTTWVFLLLLLLVVRLLAFCWMNWFSLYQVVLVQVIRIVDIVFVVVAAIVSFNYHATATCYYIVLMMMTTMVVWFNKKLLLIRLLCVGVCVWRYVLGWVYWTRSCSSRLRQLLNIQVFLLFAIRILIVIASSNRIALLVSVRVAFAWLTVSLSLHYIVV